MDPSSMAFKDCREVGFVQFPKETRMKYIEISGNQSEISK